MIYDIESRLVRTAADQLGIPVYDNILIINISVPLKWDELNN